MTNTYYVPKRNIFIEKNEKYTNWNCIQGVPCKIISKNNNYVELLSFTRDQKSKITTERLNTDFIKAELVDNVIINCDYEGGLNINEFDILEEIKVFHKNINDIIKKCKNKHIISVFKEKSTTIKSSNGCCKSATLADIKNFNRNQRNLISYQPFFNRTKRWMKYMHNGISIEDMTLNNYTNDINYPSPLGIRKKDFALPSQYLKTVKQLYLQILNFKDFPSEIRTLFSNIISLGQNTLTHACRYCNSEINILNVKTEQYKSSDNSIELCHDNPNLSFTENNVYWGCGECNREQGGFTIEQRMLNGLKLLKFTCKNKNEFIQKISNLYDIHLQ